MKRQWRILQIPAEYDMDIQAQIPAALCALHNFVRRYDPEDDGELGGVNPPDEDVEPAGVLADGPADAAERRRADRRRDDIAEEMWVDYQRELRRRGIV